MSDESLIAIAVLFAFLVAVASVGRRESAAAPQECVSAAPPLILAELVERRQLPTVDGGVPA